MIGFLSISVSWLAMEFGCEVETFNLYLTLCNLALYNYVHVQYFFQYFEDINPKDTLKPVWHVQIAVDILCSDYVAKLRCPYFWDTLYVLWSNALCLNISKMNSLIKPGCCTYLVTAFCLVSLHINQLERFSGLAVSVLGSFWPWRFDDFAQNLARYSYSVFRKQTIATNATYTSASNPRFVIYVFSFWD